MFEIEKQNKLLVLTESGEKYIVRLEYTVNNHIKSRSYKFYYLYNITKNKKITLNAVSYIDEDAIENMETLDMFMLENILNL